MKWLILVLASLAGCGGRIEPSSEASSGASSDHGTPSSDGGPVVCASGSDGSCVFCGDEWYCPSGAPEPQCPAGANYQDPCSSDCVSCGAPAGYGPTGPFANTAWVFTCVDGMYQTVSDGQGCTKQ